MIQSASVFCGRVERRDAESDEELEQVTNSDDYRAAMKRYRDLFVEKAKYETEPTESGDFVWLFRRK